MKRFHIHVGVRDLKQSVRFYSAMFAAEPTVQKIDYAKWMVEDPRLAFSISTRASVGVDHVGIQAENNEELEEIGTRLAQADVSVTAQKGTSCCYAKSDKYWTVDPQGVAWEAFHTLGSVPVFGDGRSERQEMLKTACCGAADDAVKSDGCCAPA